MHRIPPGWATDLAILELTGSTVDDHGDHLVVRSPDNPAYHWGNCLLVTDPSACDDALGWLERFKEEFPHATWFAAGLAAMPGDLEAWARHGIELEQLDVLTTATLPRAVPLPDGYSVRHLRDDDWELMAERDIAENLSTGEYDPEVHESFVRKTISTRQRLCAEGAAAWFGAFAGSELAADIGIVRCGSVARYQAVGTHASHRRRGLASHLLGVAAGWSTDRGCDTWVIVTESTNDAGRVYRRAGFTLDDAEVNAYRRPPLSTP
jgi:GNAT superfamily N-acetyltransferase